MKKSIQIALTSIALVLVSILGLTIMLHGMSNEIFGRGAVERGATTSYYGTTTGHLDVNNRATGSEYAAYAEAVNKSWGEYARHQNMGVIDTTRRDGAVRGQIITVLGLEHNTDGNGTTVNKAEWDNLMNNVAQNYDGWDSSKKDIWLSLQEDIRFILNASETLYIPATHRVHILLNGFTIAGDFRVEVAGSLMLYDKIPEVQEENYYGDFVNSVKPDYRANAWNSGNYRRTYRYGDTTNGADHYFYMDYNRGYLDPNEAGKVPTAANQETENGMPSYSGSRYIKVRGSTLGAAMYRNNASGNRNYYTYGFTKINVVGHGTLEMYGINIVGNGQSYLNTGLDYGSDGIINSITGTATIRLYNCNIIGNYLPNNGGAAISVRFADLFLKWCNVLGNSAGPSNSANSYGVTLNNTFTNPSGTTYTVPNKMCDMIISGQIQARIEYSSLGVVSYSNNKVYLFGDGARKTSGYDEKSPLTIVDMKTTTDAGSSLGYTSFETALQYGNISGSIELIQNANLPLNRYNSGLFVTVRGGANSNNTLELNQYIGGIVVSDYTATNNLSWTDSTNTYKINSTFGYGKLNPGPNIGTSTVNANALITKGTVVIGQGRNVTIAAGSNAKIYGVGTATLAAKYQSGNTTRAPAIATVPSRQTLAAVTMQADTQLIVEGTASSVTSNGGTGTVEVAGGTATLESGAQIIDLYGTGTANIATGATATVVANKTLNIANNNGGILNVNASATVTTANNNSGTITVNTNATVTTANNKGGTLTVNGTVTTATNASGAINVKSGGVIGTANSNGGTLTIEGTVNDLRGSAGTVTINAAGQATVAGTLSAEVTNNGTLTVSGTNANASKVKGNGIVNVAGGSVTLISGAQISDLFGASGAAIINTSATATVKQGKTLNGANNNGGTLTVAGTVNNLTGSAGTVTINASGQATVTGTLSAEVTNNGTLTVSGTNANASKVKGNGIVNVAGGSVTLISGAQISDLFGASGAAIINTSATATVKQGKTLNGANISGGTLTVAGTVNNLTGSAGTVTINTNAKATVTGNLVPTVTNNGTLIVGNSGNAANVTGTGIVEMQGGLVTLISGANISDLFGTSGTATINTNATAIVIQGKTLSAAINNGGTLDINGTVNSLSGTGTITINSTGQATGTGNLPDIVTNNNGTLIVVAGCTASQVTGNGTVDMQGGNVTLINGANISKLYGNNDNGVVTIQAGAQAIVTGELKAEVSLPTTANTQSHAKLILSAPARKVSGAAVIILQTGGAVTAKSGATISGVIRNADNNPIFTFDGSMTGTLSNNNDTFEHSNGTMTISISNALSNSVGSTFTLQSTAILTGGSLLNNGGTVNIYGTVRTRIDNGGSNTNSNSTVNIYGTIEASAVLNNGSANTTNKANVIMNVYGVSITNTSISNHGTLNVNSHNNNNASVNRVYGAGDIVIQGSTASQTKATATVTVQKGNSVTGKITVHRNGILELLGYDNAGNEY